MLPTFDFAPYRCSGVVVGALLNHAPQLAALGAAVDAAPYKAAPRAPVLQVKPRNTFAADGAAVEVPAGVAALEMGASLAMVIGRTACRVQVADALAHIAGYTLAIDISVPVHSHYRPAVRQRARDGFCPLGPQVVPAAQLPRPDELALDITIDGEIVQRTHTAERVRGVAQLLADVSAFMTLQPGDVLLLGAAAGAPLARAGQCVSAHIAGVGTLRIQLVAAP
jgi:5-oxopent-3-ene-1,2,5-tricarboxylate decarboxylase/2-hydroxyhepta-2,4-diene-1,7-dioate isomerase